MKKILMIILGSSLMLACTKELDENPNKSGNSVIYHMDQLVAMNGNNVGMSGYVGMETLYASDDCDISPFFYTNSNISVPQYGTSIWDKNTYLNDLTPVSFQSTFRPMVGFNTVLENLDKVTQTTTATRDQVKGEALFLRAYYHFWALVLYGKWDPTAPGIGYKDNTTPGVVPERKTVQYTLDRISQDITDAEAALTSSGRTNFEPTRKFRATLPTLKALQARVELYKGNYAKALECANYALSKHSALQNIVTDPNYNLIVRQVLTIKDGATTVGTLPYTEITLLNNTTWSDEVMKFNEWYYPHVTDVYFSRAFNMSESIYNLYDKTNDQRYVKFWANNSTVRTNMVNLQKSVYDKLKPWEFHSYLRFANSGSSGKHFMVGLTTAEMYLIKAECLARAGNTAAAKQELTTLRLTRFSDATAAGALTGSVQDVLDERRRELHALRWYDIKRLNGKENANISITKVVLANMNDKTTTATTTKTLAPNDPFFAIPIPATEAMLMGWAQN